MLLRKEAAERIFETILEKQVLPLLSMTGFKFSKSKHRFEKGDKDFIVVVSFSAASSPLSFDGENDQVQFEFSASITIEHKRYQKWYVENINKDDYFVHKLQSHIVIAPVEFDDFSREDFYEPSQATAFKQRVAASLAQHSGQSDSIMLKAFLSDLPTWIAAADELCDYKKLVSARPHPLRATYVNLLLYYKDIDAARALYQENFRTLLEEYKKTLKEVPSNPMEYLSIFEDYQSIGERFLGIQLTVPDDLRLRSTNIQKTFSIVQAKLAYREQFTLPYKEIIAHAIDPTTGRVLVGHRDQVITLWSPAGELLLQKQLTYPDGFSKLSQFPVAYLPHLKAFCANNYIVTEDLQVHVLEIPIAKQKKDKYDIGPRLPVPVAYCPELHSFIMLFDHLSTTYVFFYDEHFRLTRQFQTKYRPMDILLQRQWIAVYEYMKKIVLLDFNGDVVAELESSNANLGTGIVNYHDVSSRENFLFSFFYNVKSALFSLPDFKRTVLWGHPTFEKDYKEHYNNVGQNFGVSPARFSPDETYIVAGADHGKYVAWTLPGGERRELIPNAEYRKNLPDSLLFSIGKNTYLKNRGHEIRDIQFYKNGDFFTILIDEDLLLWDRNFNHLETLEGTGTIVPFSDHFLTAPGINGLTVYKLETK